MKISLAILVTVSGVTCSPAAVDFSRYAPILERRPFSTAVPDAAVVEPATVTVTSPPEFVRDLRIVAMTESPAGIRVGFMNISAKPPKPYYLYVGVSDDGILLVEADYDGQRALLRKGEEQYWMTMGTGGEPTKTKPAPSALPVIRASSAPVPSVQSAGDEARAISYAERRRQRIEEMRVRAQESRNLSEEEVENRLREYQMKLIREGKTPLPIPITEEMDAQLVKEGILPPAQ